MEMTRVEMKVLGSPYEVAIGDVIMVAAPGGAVSGAVVIGVSGGFGIVAHLDRGPGVEFAPNSRPLVLRPVFETADESSSSLGRRGIPTTSPKGDA